MVDIDYNAIFGVKDAGEKEQEPAEPDNTAEKSDIPADNADNDDTAAGADNAPDTPESGTDDAAAPGADDKPDAKAKPAQDADTNGRYAAARRRAEEEAKAREDKIRADAEKKISDIFAGLNIKDPYTGKMISSKDEYDAYQTRIRADQEAKALDGAGIDRETLNGIIANNPEVKAAKDAAEKYAAAERAANFEKAKAQIDAEIAEISKIDPAIKSVNDLEKMENYPRFRALIEHGNTITEAYTLVNLDRVVKARQQDAVNKELSKEHLTRTTARGQGAKTVPADVMAQYKLLTPNATEAQITAHYNKSKK